MSYKIRTSLDRHMEETSLDVEENYIAYLRHRGDLLEMDNVAVDLTQLADRNFVCDTNLCISCGKKGFKAKTYSCCVDTEVALSDDEVARIEKLLPKIKKELGRNESEEFNFVEYNDIFQRVLKHKKSKACVFLTQTEQKEYYCSIHAVCLKEGLDPHDHKPHPCYMWPLYLVEFEDDRYLLTVVSKEIEELLEEDERIGGAQCLENPPEGSLPFFQAFSGTIQYIFGEEFYGRLEQAARSRLAQKG